jgi:NAD(P)-dependent dehydrogenase (short-subunit alcohol dehydrogenase family)
MATNSSIALITGGTSGIGRAVANKLAQLGIHVLVVGRNAERGEKTVAEIRAAGGKADFISSDLRDASSAREVARRAVALGNGRVDILINNAGSSRSGRRMKPRKKCLIACIRSTSRCRTSSSRNLLR